MPRAVEIRPTRDARGGDVYRVTVSVGGGLAVVRDFKSKEDAERFASTTNGRPGRRTHP